MRGVFGGVAGEDGLLQRLEVLARCLLLLLLLLLLLVLVLSLLLTPPPSSPFFMRCAPLFIFNLPLYEQLRRLLGLEYLN